MDQQQPATGPTIDLSRLGDKFPASAIEWRIGRAGKKQDGSVWATALPYITNRAIMARLDDVCGPGNWKNEFKEWTVGGKAGVICGISIRVNGEWITKHDGAENTDVESVKGGFSDAMKRAAVQWGIGRYLYDLTETWAVVTEKGEHAGSFKDKTNEVVKFRWNPPLLPVSALPGGEQSKASTPGNQPKPAAQQPVTTKKEQPKKPDAATPAQVQCIKKLAAQIFMDVEEDLYRPRGIALQPTKAEASSIITSLKSKLATMPPRNKKLTDQKMAKEETGMRTK